jgi:Replication initiation factor
MQGWARSVESYDCDGFKLGAVYLGGREDVHVVSTSAAADWTRPAVVALHGARTARVDTRVDTLASFDVLAQLCEVAADTYNSVVTTMESRRGGQSEGRTVYLGSPRSMVRVRVYEKWLESPGQYVEGTNRVEVQLRPVSQSKARVSELTPAETFCATKTTRDLAAQLGGQAVDAGSLRVRRGTPDLEASLAAMGRQYRKVVDRHLARSGGDLGRVLDYLTGQAAASS